jgi:glycine/D-amino acid oxidase-like deaminating enzyme
MPAAPFDVAVVGAGIVGAAVAAELARRGVRVGLFDRGEVSRHDRASARATSSSPTRTPGPSSG